MTFALSLFPVDAAQQEQVRRLDFMHQFSFELATLQKAQDRDLRPPLEVGEVQFRFFIPQGDAHPADHPGAAGHQDQPQERAFDAFDEQMVKVNITGDIANQKYAVHVFPLLTTKCRSVDQTRYIRLPSAHPRPTGSATASADGWSLFP